MKTFQVIFQTGRVQNILADKWNKERGVVRFELEGIEAASFRAPDLIMIDQLDEERAYTPWRKRQKENARLS